MHSVCLTEKKSLLFLNTKDIYESKAVNNDRLAQTSENAILA